MSGYASAILMGTLRLLHTDFCDVQNFHDFMETSNATCAVYQNSTGGVLKLPPQNKMAAICILARVQAKLTGKA